MSKRPISFRISKEILETIRNEATQRNQTLSAIIEERLNPYSDVRR